MSMFNFDELCSNTVGGAILGGAIGSLFGDTPAEKTLGAIGGAILGDIISDELEDYSPRREVRVSRPVYIETSYRVSNDSFGQFKVEVERETRSILAMYCAEEKKRAAMSALRQRVRTRFYAGDISYHQAQELYALIDGRAALI